MIVGVRPRQTHQNTPKHQNQPLSTAQKHCSPVPADSISQGSRSLAVAFLCLQTPYSEVSDDLQLLGFEPGWGNTIARAKDTMNLALNLLEAPDSVRLFDFLSRMPNMFNVIILSPHGFFGQKDVLGKPDTGGQVGLLLHAMCMWNVTDCSSCCCVAAPCKLAGCWQIAGLAGCCQVVGLPIYAMPFVYEDCH